MKKNDILRALAAGLWLAPLLVALGCGGDAVELTRASAAETHDIHDEERAVLLDDATIAQFGIEMADAGPGRLAVTTELPGEVQVNGDRMAHVTPRVGGVVREVLASLGDQVREGQVMAVLESRELADAKADFLAANERLGLAQATFEREERLWRDRVSSEQDYLDARNGLAEARIAFRAAEQKLHALGFSQAEVGGLSEEHDVNLTLYRVTAPFDGTVIQRHITLGETVSAAEPVFTVADLSSVWIDLSVYQKNIGAVHAGQSVRVTTANGDEAELPIAFVQPLVGEETRTALARIIADNSQGIWHPGFFVTAHVATSTAEEVPVLAPLSAVIRMEDGDDVVFVETEHGFEPRAVSLGQRSKDQVEIVAGLEPGERYVVRGGFSLKAELGKEAFGEGHGH